MPSASSIQLPRRLATVTIGDTVVEIIESPCLSSCNNCCFGVRHEAAKPTDAPLCVLPDYLACRPYVSFRVVETERGGA